MMGNVGGMGFEDWYLREHDRLIAAVAVIVGDVGVAEEAVDEAMARSWLRWNRVSAMASPTGWTFRVAVNTAKRQFRRRELERRLLRTMPPVDP
jgi:RNA polymerase sigma-70 factor (ECF subfamily)